MFYLSLVTVHTVSMQYKIHIMFYFLDYRLLILTGVWAVPSLSFSEIQQKDKFKDLSPVVQSFSSLIKLLVKDLLSLLAL